MEFVNIALAKGRLAEKTIKMMNNQGITFPDYHTNSRKLIFENDFEKIRIIFVKPSDVAIYVEKGAADLGVLGKDILMESEADLYEVMDLGFGSCKFAVAALRDYVDLPGKKIRVASKFPNVSKKYFNELGRPIEVIKLNGSVELAPIIGLADVIVDIVETGKTLEENGLVVINEICKVSARLVANKVSFKTKMNHITRIIEGLKRGAE
ncbi:ATP phosphoribosyltransferase [Geosporobacter ferrireducens]|uniref:ATP phosphoribosyltransferase n=1 Tax=Geosporobacter ferrireducens TaxID=1424294 RepID=A0A1D8GP02_9FIRM|nr:ATP phosphoribosyltransferase [Geosporobacter ferrireducens]AOT72670.1 ATP phosphoribosyltransferase [Geosporobacter ferrireducens]MTI55077.1 ATP phosphoribosyltransferase [Geosporobacter ferrireducens]